MLSRPLTITQPSIAPIGYGYDSASNRTKLKYPDGKLVTYTYDFAGRLLTVKDWASASTVYAYDVASRLLTATLPNTVISKYAYDAANHLTGMTHTLPSGATALRASFLYTYDKAGNRTHAVEQVRQPDDSLTTTALTYTYDALYRLTTAAYSTANVFTYTYDAVGNRLTEHINGGSVVTSIYDAANRLTQVGSQTYTWDANGNLLSDDPERTYTYDTANRLTRVDLVVDEAYTTYTYLYNGLGDRARQSVNSAPTPYALDLNAGLTQVLTDTTNVYLYGHGRIAQYAGATPSYFLGDALGSVRQLANGSGSVTLAAPRVNSPLLPLMYTPPPPQTGSTPNCAPTPPRPHARGHG